MVTAAADARNAFVLLNKVFYQNRRVLGLQMRANSKLSKVVASNCVEIVQVSDESCVLLTTRNFPDGDSICAKARHWLI